MPNQVTQQGKLFTIDNCMTHQDDFPQHSRIEFIHLPTVFW